MAPKFARKRPASALCTVPVPCSTVSTAPAPDSTASEEAKKRQEKIVPWNKGTKMAKSDMQHLFIPKQDYNLFLAVAIYFAGPKYAMAMWLTMATSRRISEALRLHGCDAYLEGGPHHDSPHILFQKREKEKQFPGAGKLGGQNVVARLSADACATLKSVMETMLKGNCCQLWRHFKKVTLRCLKISIPWMRTHSSGQLMALMCFQLQAKNPRNRGWLASQCPWRWPELWRWCFALPTKDDGTKLSKDHMSLCMGQQDILQQLYC